MKNQTVYFIPKEELTLPEAFSAAVMAAVEHGKPIIMQRSGMQFEIGPDSSYESVEDLLVRGRLAQMSRNLPRDQVKQREVDALLGLLPDAIAGGDSAVVTWIGMFIGPSSEMTVTMDRGAVARQLLAAGYQRNAEVGSNSEALRDNHQRYAHYIVGQALDRLMDDRAIHGMLGHFIQEYQELFSNMPQSPPSFGCP